MQKPFKPFTADRSLADVFVSIDSAAATFFTIV
jgi:hypothetical protein